MPPRPSLLRIAREQGVPLDPDDRERLALIDRVVHPSYHPEYLGTALWFNHWFNPGEPLRVLQCVWPDRQQRFPWDPQVDQAIRERQPVLVGSGSPGVDRP